MLHHVPRAELQDQLFAEVARVLRPGAAFVATDSLGSDDLRDFHEGDTYVPIDPAGLEARLTGAGFTVGRRRGQRLRLGRSGLRVTERGRVATVARRSAQGSTVGAPTIRDGYRRCSPCWNEAM